MLAWPLLLVYLGLAAAFLVRLVTPSAYVFATVSNLTYGMAGLACTPALQTPARRKAGATPRGALPLLILGAASAAHHARPRSGLAAHHLDIVFGWFLVAATFIMSLVYFGINTVAHRLADPFGTDSDDISLDSFATQIQEDLDGYVRNWSSSGASPSSSEGPYQRTAHQP